METGRSKKLWLIPLGIRMCKHSQYEQIGEIEALKVPLDWGSSLSSIKLPYRHMKCKCGKEWKTVGIMPDKKPR